jgi:hypothetical protein
MKLSDTKHMTINDDALIDIIGFLSNDLTNFLNELHFAILKLEQQGKLMPELVKAYELLSKYEGE